MTRLPILAALRPCSASLLMALLTSSCALPVTAPNPAAMPKASTIYLVRHAEKSADGGRDPALSTTGRARAEALAASLAPLGIQAIYATPLQRTQQTARPLATALGLPVQVIGFGGGIAAHVQAVVAALDKSPAGSKILVVGHSNTIPAIAEALAAQPVADMPEDEFSRLLIVERSQPPRLSTARFGAEDDGSSTESPAPEGN